MINRYLKNLDDLINSYVCKGFLQFEGPDSKVATLNDLVWYYIEPKTNRKKRILCIKYKYNKHGDQSDSTLNEADSLPYPYNFLLKIYIIDVFNKNHSLSHKASLIIDARYILSNLINDLYDCPQEIWEAKRKTTLKFWNFCNTNKLIINRKKPNVHIDFRERTGDESIQRKKQKMPSNFIIEALGQCFVNTFKDVDENGVLCEKGAIDMTDALTCSFALIALASPDRMSAEIPVLPTQKLHSFVEGNNIEPVYYLDWQGSKGYKPNKKHILSSLSKVVGKVINFFNIACEPNRILAAYYENPKTSLNTLIKNFKINKEMHQRVTEQKKLNLFTLGYALGFYDIDETISIVKDVDKVHRLQQHKKPRLINKPIYRLQGNDYLHTVSSSDIFFKLFGTNFTAKFVRQFGRVSKVSELESFWINYFKSTLSPSFPRVYSTSETSAYLPSLLFCLTKHQLRQGFSTGGKPLTNSKFNILPPTYISSLVKRTLRPPKGSNYLNIFEKNGFGKEIQLNPNQLRHYGNTIAHMSDIPIELITAWSGRKSVSQTLEYIHTSEEDKSEKLKSIMGFSSNHKINIKVITQEELKSLNNIPASITSTGICTQELNTTPCDYLNQFISQCFMCPSACHIAGDSDTISLIEKDLAFQNKRLDLLKKDLRFNNSNAMRKWWSIHSINTVILSTLLSLLKTENEGVIIRYIDNNHSFTLFDNTKKTLNEVKVKLPNVKDIINTIIENNNKNIVEDDNALQNLLTSFGIKKD